MDSVLTCLVSDDLGPGALAESLATEISGYVGADSGLCLRDYATAIEVALASVGLAEGSRVVISPLAPEIYIRVLDELNLHPVFPDVDPVTACLKIEDVRQLVSDGASAIVLHYTMGIIPEIDPIVELGVPIVEDISQGIGGIAAEHRIGAYGRITVVSLEPTQLITSGGGAAVFAVNKRDRSSFRDAAAAVPKERIMPNMNAALGLQQIKRLERYIEKRKEIASIFNRAVLRGRHKMLVQPGDAENVFYSFAVVLSGGAKEVIQYCSRKQVDVQRAFDDSILAKMMRRAESSGADRGAVGESSDAPSDSDGVSARSQSQGVTVVESSGEQIPSLPGANALLLRCVLFPLYPALPKRDIERLEKVLSSLP